MQAACEHLFVTSQGHPYARFRRALSTGNPTLAWAAAAELPTLSLVDALALTLLLAGRDPGRFGRAALRWHGRFCAEAFEVDLEEGLAVLVLLSAIRDRPGPASLRALADLLAARGDSELAAVARRSLVERGSPAATS